MNDQSTARGGPGRASYYASAGSWAEDVQGGLRRSRKVAWMVAAAAATIAILEAFALVLLMPLKTAVPYVFVVDRQTGYVESARSLEAGPLTQNAAVTQSYLVQYVLARETFDVNDLRSSYHKAMLLSAPAVRDQYARDMRPTAPDSPLRRYHKTTQVKVTVKSVSLLGPHSALIRFDTDRLEAGQSPQRSSYGAVVGFRYLQRSMPMAERFENPLGFQVTSYRRDVEWTPPPPPAPATPESAPAATMSAQ